MDSQHAVVSEPLYSIGTWWKEIRLESIIMIAFGVGFLSGVVAACLLTWVAMWSIGRHSERRMLSLEKRVDKLYRNLACGKGIVGCDGGPNCQWDHK